jgi:two-component system, NtrC family, response regulator HydG
MKKSLLIIDDDLYITRLLENFFQREGYHAHSMSRGKPALQWLKKQNVDVVLCDIRLPDINGADLLKHIRQLSPGTAVIMMTAYAEIRSAVDAIKSGAFDYVTKPVFPEEISSLVNKAIQAKQKAGLPQPDEFITGKSPKMLALVKQARLVAPTDMSVLIQGETGSGKEYVARLIHQASLRKGKKFVAIDCGAIPRELASSELFGHVKGAFTGAIANKAGYFEVANGGTIFLDEIGNLSYETQVKLLRAIQHKVINRVGDSKPIAVDVRIISATNRNLLDATHEDHFREDLYHRINEFKLELPPLRQRGEDIVIFARHFLQEANLELRKQVKDFAPETIQAITAYGWYGNLRELRNVVKRSVLIATGDVITNNCLPEEMHQNHEAEKFASSPGVAGFDLKQAAKDAEKIVVERALREANNNKSLAAKLLKIDRKTLYNKINELGIEP